MVSPAPHDASETHDELLISSDVDSWRTECVKRIQLEFTEATSHLLAGKAWNCETEKELRKLMFLSVAAVLLDSGGTVSDLSPAQQELVDNLLRGDPQKQSPGVPQVDEASVASGTIGKESYGQFIKRLAGSFGDEPFERPPQGDLERREEG